MKSQIKIEGCRNTSQPNPSSFRKTEPPRQNSKIRFWFFPRLLALSLTLGVSLSARSDQITDHIVRVALEPLNIYCVEAHGAYKIALSLSEATITPPVRFHSTYSIYSSGPNGIGVFKLYDQCVRSVRDIHRRYPRGLSFVVRRTLQESWVPGCPNDRCPKLKIVTESVYGKFDGRLFSADR